MKYGNIVAITTPAKDANRDIVGYLRLLLPRDEPDVVDDPAAVVEIPVKPAVLSPASVILFQPISRKIPR